MLQLALVAALLTIPAALAQPLGGRWPGVAAPLPPPPPAGPPQQQQPPSPDAANASPGGGCSMLGVLHSTPNTTFFHDALRATGLER